MELYWRCAESNLIWLVNQWGWCFKETVHFNSYAGKHTLWVNVNFSADLGMVNGVVENVTDTFSKNCVMPLQLLTCLLSLFLRAIWNKKRAKLICNYFIFWYTKASMLKVFSWFNLTIKSCCKVWYHHKYQTCAWKHGWANSYVKLYFSGLGLHNFLSRHEFVWMDSVFLVNQDDEQFINWHMDTSSWEGGSHPQNSAQCSSAPT